MLRSKNIYLAVALAGTAIALGQPTREFLSGAGKRSLPLVIDELVFRNLPSYQKHTYKDIAPFLFNPATGIGFRNTSPDAEVFAYGTFELGKKTALITIMPDYVRHSLNAFLLVYSENGELLNSLIIARYNNIPKDGQSESALILPEQLIVWDSENIEDAQTYIFPSEDRDFLFAPVACSENPLCIDYKPSQFCILKRPMGEMRFDRAFFEAGRGLIPLQYASPYELPQSEGSDSRQYFLNAVGLQNDRNMILFMTESVVGNVKKSSVGYQIATSVAIEQTHIIARYETDLQDHANVSEAHVKRVRGDIEIDFKENGKAKKMIIR